MTNKLTGGTMKLLTPNLYLNTIFELDTNKLKAIDIKGLIIDIDNTLTGWDSKHACIDTVNWLMKLKDEGFKICLVSNNNKKRVVEFNKEMNFPMVFSARKPRRTPFKKAVKILGTDIYNTAVIGDQIFTDVLGGNRTGLFTILVVPIKSKEFWWTAFVRHIEKHVIKLVLKNK